MKEVSVRRNPIAGVLIVRVDGKLAVPGISSWEVDGRPVPPETERKIERLLKEADESD